MASDECISECLTVLELMKGDEWKPGHIPLYSRVIAPWEDEFARKVVQTADDTLTWRPSRAELRTLAAKIAAPIPDDDECYAEIVHKLETIGPYGRPDPANPAVMLEGAPPMSHPIVSQIVAYCGGWFALCNGEANFAEGVKKQIRSAHESVSARWLEGAASHLALPPDVRDQKYFRAYPRYELPPGYVPGVEIDVPQIAPPKRTEGVPMPPDVRRMIAGIGREMPKGNENATDKSRV